MKDLYDRVIASYHRCRQGGSAFFDTFYEIFLAKSPQIQSKFARTDFVRQKLMLKQSLLEMLNFYCGVPSVREEIEKLGRLHQALDIRPDHYDLWLDSLCEAVARHDPELEPGLDELWRIAMRPGIEVMTSVRRVTS